MLKRQSRKCVCVWRCVCVAMCVWLLRASMPLTTATRPRHPRTPQRDAAVAASKVVEQNISRLYATAVAEIKRKDRMIADLRESPTYALVV